MNRRRKFSSPCICSAHRLVPRSPPRTNCTRPTDGSALVAPRGCRRPAEVVPPPERQPRPVLQPDVTGDWAQGQMDVGRLGAWGHERRPLTIRERRHRPRPGPKPSSAPSHPPARSCFLPFQGPILPAQGDGTSQPRAHDDGLERRRRPCSAAGEAEQGREGLDLVRRVPEAQAKGEGPPTASRTSSPLTTRLRLQCNREWPCNQCHARRVPNLCLFNSSKKSVLPRRLYVQATNRRNSESPPSEGTAPLYVGAQPSQCFSTDSRW